MVMQQTLLQVFLAAALARVAHGTCTYPNGGSIAQKQAYFACLSSACEDTLGATVSTLSGGDETSCMGALAGIWTCNADISFTVIGVPGSTVKDMCPAACNACATTTMTTTMTSATPTSAAMCTYPSGGLITEKEAYFACLSSACEDTSAATVSALSGGGETSCAGAVAGSWACDDDISMTVIGVPDSTVEDMCPATCNACITTTLTSTTSTSTRTSQFLSTTVVPSCAYVAHSDTAVRRHGTGGKKLKRASYNSDTEYLDACKANCNADSKCNGFVDDPTDRRGRMCKPKASTSGYRKSNKTFHVKGNEC